MIVPQVDASLDFLLQPHTALQGAVLTVVACSLTPIIVVWARRLFPGRFVHFARWGFSHVVIAAALYLTLTMVAGLALFGGGGEDPSIELQLIASAFVQGIVCALVMHWASKRDPNGVRSLGLWRGRHLTAIVTGILVYLLCIPILIGLQLMWPWLLTRMGEDYAPQSFQGDFLTSGGIGLWVAIVLAVAVIPLFEEILFRAFLQPLLVQNFRDKGGIVLTSAIFAGLHGPSVFLPIFGLSLVLGAIMLRTQRLAAVWAVHALHNGWQLMTLFAVEAESSAGLLF